MSVMTQPEILAELLSGAKIGEVTPQADGVRITLRHGRKKYDVFAVFTGLELRKVVRKKKVKVHYTEGTETVLGSALEAERPLVSAPVAAAPTAP